MRAWPLIVPAPPPPPPPRPVPIPWNAAGESSRSIRVVTAPHASVKMSATYFSSARVSALSFGLCLPQGPGTMRYWVLCFRMQENAGHHEWKRDSVIFSARSVEAAVFPPMSGGSVITVNDQVNNCLWIMIFMVQTAKFLSGLVKCAQSLSSV